MPTKAYTKGEIDDAELVMQAVLALGEDSDSDCEDLQEVLLLACAEPFNRQLKQTIGFRRLSIARLREDIRAHGVSEDDVSWTVYHKFGFRLADLEAVVQALDVPALLRTRGQHCFTGEEATLLLLRRFRSPGALLALTEESGRSVSAISEVVQFMVEFICTRCVLPCVALHASQCMVHGGDMCGVLCAGGHIWWTTAR